MAKNDKQVKRGVYLYIDGKQINNDINSIDMEVRKLQKDIKAMQRGSEEYNRTMAKIQHLKKILRDHQREIKGVTEEHKKASISVRGMVDWFNQFGGAIVAAIGFLTGVTLALRKFREERNKLETAQASLKALTGLDDDSISWLTEQAKTLSTTMTKEGLRVRQSAAEILDAFMLIGSAKPELLGDKEALKQVTEEAMRLQAAAGDIKLSEAVDSLTLSLNQYGESADQAARYANVLAAGSQAGSANIASQASAIRNAGTAAASANVSIEQTVGLIETLAYRGIKDEVAGTGLKKFFLTLQTGADETNPKIVGLEKALENLAAKNMGAADIKKMFGEEGYNTASVLMQNTQMVKDYTKAVTDTNVATEQAAINSNTAAAALDQARNKMLLAAADLGDKLTPAFTISTNMATNLVKILPGLIDWFKEWGGTVVWLSGCWMVYSTRLKIAAAYHAIINTVTKAGTAIQLAYGIAMNTINGYTITAIEQKKKLTLIMAGHNTLLKILRSSTYLYASAVFLMRGRIDLATKSMRASWAVLRLHPFGLLITAVALAGTAFLKFGKSVDEATAKKRKMQAINDEAAKSVGEEKRNLEQLTKILRDNSVTYDQRKAALDKIQSIVPEYHASLTKEGKLIEANAALLDGYIKKMVISAKQQAANAKLQEAINTRSDWFKDQDKETNLQFKDIEWSLNDPMNNKGLDEIAASKGVSPTAFRVWQAKKKRLDEDVNLYKSMMEQYTKEMLKIDAQMAEAANASNDVTNTTPIVGDTDASDKDKVNKEIEQIELNHITQMNELRRLYLEGQFESDKEYSAAQVDLVQKTLNQKLSVMGLEPAEREKIQEQLLESMIKFNKECQKEDEKDFKEAKSLRYRQCRVEIEEATNRHYKEQSSEEDFQQELANIRKRYWEDMLNNYKLTEEEKLKIKEDMAKEESEKDKSQIEESKARARDYAELTRTIASEYGETIGQMIADGELNLKNFLRETILMALDALERIVEMAIIEITVKNLAATAPFSFIGAAKAAVQIAAIKAAFAAVKGIVSNFYTGGYTPSGAWDQPQGIVHSDEFVANRFAVANPNLRPLFDAIDVAQKSGNVGKLTMDDVMAVSRHTQSTPKSSSHTTSIGGDTNKDTAMLIASVNLLNSAVKKLSNRLDKDINAIVTISGRNGVAEKMDTYNQMINNKKR